MPTQPRRLWHEMATTDFAALDPARTVAVLPVAAVESHGPHLPLWVDACLCQGIVARALALMPDGLPATVLPMMAVGKSDEHVAFPGTLTLSAETLIRVWTEIGDSVARAGIRKLVLFNSHGGQPQVMDIVARDLRARRRMLVVTASWWALGLPDGLFPPGELRHGIHGGGIETSMMLHLRPDLVRDDARRDFVPATVAMERDYVHLRAEGGGIGFGWQTQDLHPDGACGNALDADAERGRQLVDNAAARLVALLAEVSRFPLSALRDREPV